jgi:DNA-binding beta-propeller fold protein YncE
LNTVIVYDMDTGEARRLTGDAGNGKMQQANNIAIDETGKIYIADKIRQAVLVYDSDEKYLNALGRPGEIEPVDVAIGPERLYVCDIKNHRIEIWDRSNGALLKAFGGQGNGPGQFYLPTQAALDPQGNLFITDTGNFRVQKFTADGEFLRMFGGLGNTHGKFSWPKGLDIDSRGRSYVADSRFANVQIFDDEGRLLLFFGGPGQGGGNLDLPAGVFACPWPSIRWLDERLADGFDPEELIIVVSQKGAGFINFFAVARDSKDSS